jgi:hypothetical protein
LSWNAESSTVIYRIYRNGILIGQTTELEFIDEGVGKHQTDTYQVRAVDIFNTETIIGTITIS